MTWFKDTYNTIFFGFLLSIILVFFYFRPLNSPWHPFIAGDGLGYYAYLPAQFIYNDTGFEFKWFNKAHNANYVYSAFPNPEQNLMVAYGNRRINKYYQGLSYIWLPFFAAAQVIAKSLHYPADGFSPPYQWCIGLASLVYLLIGLVFLRKLLTRLFHDRFAAAVAPIAIFYGTHLYNYGLHHNSMSHVYSFTFLTITLYYAVLVFTRADQKLLNGLLCLFFLLVSVCIRPLNGLVVVLAAGFVPAGWLRTSWRFEKVRPAHALVTLLALSALAYQLRIMHKQTGSFFPYTYSDETFNFSRSKFAEVLFSYHAGLFVYVPLIFVSLAGIGFLQGRLRIVLPVFFFFIIFLYSSWWYWPITKRAVVDFYFIPAILLAALLARCKAKGSRVLILALFGVCCMYYLFKNMQVRKGILDENATYGEVFWRNFFRKDKANIYLVPPSTILKKETVAEDFEPGSGGHISQDRAYSGASSLLLDPGNYISRIIETGFPSVFNTVTGFKKVRFSFETYAEEKTPSVHIFFQFYNKDQKVIKEVPFYLGAEDIFPGKWDYKEFGYELADSDSLTARTVKKIRFTIWNVEARQKIFIDQAKVEFIVADRSFETIK